MTTYAIDNKYKSISINSNQYGLTDIWWSMKVFVTLLIGIDYQ